MIRLNPDAAFDCLFVARRLQAQMNGFTPPELHIFAYLACLLWLYRNKAVSDWGYDFMGTELGAPFSPDIDSTIKQLAGRGYFIRTHDRMRMSDIALAPINDFGQLALNKERVECLQAACACTAAFSVGMVSSALANEPELSRAKATPLTRLLLEDAARTQLYEQFEALRAALNEKSGDLRLPAVVWLTALYRLNATGMSVK
jgi:hypothetical protein